MGKSTVAGIIPEVCDALWKRLQPLIMGTPKRKEWEDISSGFQVRWQFPNCIGALDGKHVIIQAPPNSGSQFYNYKHTFSLVLMALVDHEYCFTVVDVGGYGSNSDGGLFSSSNLGRALDSDCLDLPPNKSLPNCLADDKLPHVIVGDEAFPLKRNLLRPYPGASLDDSKRIFNYRLSRARRVAENAFGILTSKFRVYHRQLQIQPGTADKVVKATCVLHNFIMKKRRFEHRSESWNSEAGRVDVVERLQFLGNHATQDAQDIRNSFKEYFNSAAGAVSWQRDQCFGQAN